MPKGKAGPKTGGKAFKSVAEILGEANSSLVLLQPMVEGENLLIHQGATLLEFNSPALLEEVLRATTLAQYVVRRLGDQALMVDQTRQEELVKLLAKKGYEPKVLKV